MRSIRKYFEFDALNTNFRRETVGGITTFLAMCYILVVNPATLAAAGMDFNAVFASTALTAAFGTLFMGLIARYPIAMATGMGLNAFFSYTVVLLIGFTWQTAISAVFLSSMIFAILTITGVREKIINAIP